MASLLPALHSKHEVMRLLISVRPPLATANLWSATNLAPSCGVLPQYWQVKLSLLKTSNLMLRLAHGFLRIAFGFLLGRMTPPAADTTFDHFPSKYALNDPIDGNPFKRFISLYETWCPKRSDASLNRCSKISRENLSLVFFCPFFIPRCAM